MTDRLPLQRNYINSFDTVRALAVFMVMLLHGSFGFFTGGWVGVDLFFVLSGFLITSLLHKEFFQTNTISILGFYKRRILRLFPALLVTIVLANILWNTSLPYLYGVPDRKIATVAALLYFTNFIHVFSSGNLAHLWSLSVEEHFYLFWPLISLFIVFRLNSLNRIIFTAVLILLVWFFRIYAFHHELVIYKPIFIIDSNHFTLCRIDGILTGCLLFFIVDYTKLKNWQVTNAGTYRYFTLLAIAFGIIVLFLSENNFYFRNGGFIIINFLCAATILVAFKNPNHPLFNNTALKWIGIRSYGIYLYHLPVFIYFNHFRQHHDKLNFVLVSSAKVAVTIFIAFLSYKYIEAPVLKLKHKKQSNNPEKQAA